MILVEDIRDLTDRALWETENLLACIPAELWEKRYDELPLWKYVYHTLYSMDRWYINPADSAYRDPPFHRHGLADLNVVPAVGETLDRELVSGYLASIRRKLESYLAELTDDALGQCPEGCNLTRFRLILGQFRHWHRHMGLIYGFLVEDTGKWPYVLNMLGEAPKGEMPFYYP